jgi:hypothetical protein
MIIDMKSVFDAPNRHMVPFAIAEPENVSLVMDQSPGPGVGVIKFGCAPPETITADCIRLPCKITDPSGKS